MRPYPMFVTTLLLVAAFTADGCARRTATAPPPQPPPPFEQPAVVPPAPPAPIVDDRPTEPIIVPEEVSGRNIEDLNQDNPLKPAFFPLDSADLDDQASRDTATSAAPPSTTWRSESAGRWRPRTTCCRWVFPPSACGR
jgi:hypothetical protein